MCQSYTFCRQSKRKTIQRQLQNGYFMFRKHPSKPSTVVLFSSTVEKQNRNELRAAQLVYISGRNPAACSFHLRISARKPSHFSLRRLSVRYTRRAGRETLAHLGDPRSCSSPRTNTPGLQQNSKYTQLPKGIGVAHLGSALSPSE